MEDLPESTYYFWLKRIGLLYQLCIWGAWIKARREKVGLTIEGVFGDCGFAGHIYRDTRTDEMLVAFEPPGDSYEFFGEMFNGSKSTYEIKSGAYLLSGVELTGQAVHNVLIKKLGRDDRMVLERYLPFFGKFKGEALPFDEKLGMEMKRAAVDRVKGQSTRSLRDTPLPRHKIFLDDEDLVRLEIQQLLNNKVVKRAILALEQRSPVVPADSQPQKRLVDLPPAS